LVATAETSDFISSLLDVLRWALPVWAREHTHDRLPNLAQLAVLSDFAIQTSLRLLRLNAVSVFGDWLNREGEECEPVARLLFTLQV
jgi:hypothetical protein